MQHFTGFICVILAGIGFGFLGIFGRLAFNSGLTVGELLTFRFSLAAVILFFCLLGFKRTLLKISIKQFIISILLGSAGYAVFSTLYFKSIQGLSISLAAILLFTFPIFVNLGSHFILKEKMTAKQFLSLMLACGGMVILLWGPLFIDSMTSIFYALLAAVTYAIYVLVSGRFQRGVHPLSSSLYIIFAAALALAVFHQINFLSILNLQRNQIFYVFGLAVICTILPITLFLIGLQNLPSSKASIIVMIEPVVAAMAAWIILDEKLSLQQYVGIALVLGALFLNARSKKSKNW